MRKLLIIGASKGIGAAIAQIAKHDFQIVSLSRTPVNDSDLIHFQVDVAKDPLPKIEEPLAGLVYCPGSINLKPFSNLKIEDFQQDLEINLFGAVRCLKEYQAKLQASDSSSVVLFSTVAVQTGLPYHASIAAAKGAIEGLVRALAAEWAPKIRVNAIAPSITRTGLADHLLRDEAKLQAAAARHPLKRIGEPDDIAQMALFLLSDKASWITGQIMHVDGGISSIK